MNKGRTWATVSPSSVADKAGHVNPPWTEPGRSPILWCRTTAQSVKSPSFVPTVHRATRCGGKSIHPGVNAPKYLASHRVCLRRRAPAHHASFLSGMREWSDVKSPQGKPWKRALARRRFHPLPPAPPGRRQGVKLDTHLSASSGRKVTPVSFIAAICCSHSSCCRFKPRRLVILSQSSAA